MKKAVVTEVRKFSCERDTLFSHLTNVERWTEWSGAESASAETQDGRSTTNLVEARTLTTTRSGRAVVEEVEHHGHTIRLRASRSSTGGASLSTIQVSSSGDGGSQVMWSVSLEARFSRVVSRRLRRDLKASLERLSSVV